MRITNQILGAKDAKECVKKGPSGTSSDKLLVRFSFQIVQYFLEKDKEDLLWHEKLLMC